MEAPRKYSTGTKGRLARHADACRELVHRHAGDFHLATEFIESLDPAAEDSVWQRFEEPNDLLPTLDAWLRGEEPPAPSHKPPVPTPPSPFDLARKWLDDPSTKARLAAMPPLEAAQHTLAEAERLWRTHGDPPRG
jgi:acyl transferase domain-containing protein